jgi:hypothetical protein
MFELGCGPKSRIIIGEGALRAVMEPGIAFGRKRALTVNHNLKYIKDSLGNFLLT